MAWDANVICRRVKVNGRGRLIRIKILRTMPSRNEMGIVLYSTILNGVHKILFAND